MNICSYIHLNDFLFKKLEKRKKNIKTLFCVYFCTIIMKTIIEVHKEVQYTGHSGSIYAMVADTSRNLLYTSGDDGIVVQWSPEGGDTGKAVFRTDNAIYCLAISAEGKWVIAGTRNGTVYIVEPSEKRIMHISRKFNLAIFALYTDEKDSKLWILCAEGVVILMDIHTLKELHSFRIGEQNLRCIIPFKDSYLIGSGDGNIYQINKESLETEYVWAAHNNSVFSLYLTENGKTLYSGGRDAYLNCWDVLAGFAPLAKIPAHNFTINAITASPDGKFLVTASRDKTIKLWDLKDNTLLKVIDFAKNQGHLHSVNKICWLSADNLLISCGDDKRIIKWRISPKIL